MYFVGLTSPVQKHTIPDKRCEANICLQTIPPLASARFRLLHTLKQSEKTGIIRAETRPFPASEFIIGSKLVIGSATLLRCVPSVRAF
jgi:hypothetical protein